MNLSIIVIADLIRNSLIISKFISEDPVSNAGRQSIYNS